jgi:molecular chaperone DnaK
MHRLGGIAIGSCSVSGASSDRSLAPLCAPARLTVTPSGTVRLGARTEPGTVFVDFTGRVGDPVPLVGTDGTARFGADLTALAVAALARYLGATELVVAHPAAWGSYQTGVLRSALTCTSAADLPVGLVSRPLAALAGADAAIPAGAGVVVVDTGGRSTEVSLVGGGRVLDTSAAELLGTEAVDRALAMHLLAQLPGPLELAARHELVRACTAARRDLVGRPATIIEVHRPSGPERVRVVRAELAELIGDAVRDVVTSVLRALRQARRAELPVRAVLLVGPLASTPLLIEELTARVGAQPIVPSDPACAVVRGAATLTSRVNRPPRANLSA